MASGSLDANGIWIYGEDDPAALVSDLLNLLAGASSLQFTSDRGRLATLEASVGALATDSGWLVVGTSGQPTYGSGWSAYTTSPWTGLAYRRVAGIMHFSGVTQKGSGWAVNEVIFTLPTGYRPSRRMELIGDSAGNMSLITVDTDGTVRMNKAGGPGTVAFIGNFAI